MDIVLDPFELFSLDYRLGKSGTVEVIDILDRRIELIITECRRIHSEIAALGMTCDSKGPVLVRRDGALEIIQCLLLCRNRELEAHIEVFLPSYERVIGSPECDKIVLFAVKVKKACGELYLLLLVDLIDIARHLNVGESCRVLKKPYKSDIIHRIHLFAVDYGEIQKFSAGFADRLPFTDAL